MRYRPDSLLNNSFFVRSVERRIDNDIDPGRLRNEVTHDICAIVALQRHQRGADSSKRRGLRRDIRNEITVSEKSGADGPAGFISNEVLNLLLQHRGLVNA